MWTKYSARIGTGNWKKLIWEPCEIQILKNMWKT